MHRLGPLIWRKITGFLTWSFRPVRPSSVVRVCAMILGFSSPILYSLPPAIFEPHEVTKGEIANASLFLLTWALILYLLAKMLRFEERLDDK